MPNSDEIHFTFHAVGQIGYIQAVGFSTRNFGSVKDSFAKIFFLKDQITSGP